MIFKTRSKKTLGLEEHIVGVWQSLTLHKYAHRDRVHGVRRLTQGLVDEAFQAVVVVMALIDAYERHFELVLDRIADLRNGEPTTAAAEALRDLMPHDPRCMAYLFNELQDPRWWPLLRKRRFFDSPPEPEGLVHPVWPASRYLARIAANAPDRTAFVELLLKIGADTPNVRIHEDIVRSALGLPSDQACLVLAAAVAWLDQPLHGYVARLVGSRELIRFPTWLAQLLLRIATDAQSPLDLQQLARATLAALLAWEVDPGEGDVCFLECPRIVYTDLDTSWLLGAFGETGWFGGLAPCSGSQGGRKNRVIHERKFLDCPRCGAHTPHFTKYGQEPVSSCKI